MNEIAKLDEIGLAERHAQIAKQSGIIPQNLSEVMAQAVILIGREIGLAPFQALRTISFIGGRVVMSVQLQLALARQRAGVKIYELDETDDSCIVSLARGEEQVACGYTLQDAKAAGLVRAGSSWEKFPRQMLRWRAIGDALRLIAPDVVMGLVDADEAETIALASDIEPAAELKPAPAPMPAPAAQPAETKPAKPAAKNGAKEAWEKILQHADAIGVAHESVKAVWADAKNAGVKPAEFAKAFLACTSEDEFIAWSMRYEEVPVA